MEHPLKKLRQMSIEDFEQAYEGKPSA